MRVIILGVCGSLMSGIAVLAKELGYQVIGYDRHFSQPAQGVLEQNQIQCFEGYDQMVDVHERDCVILGNQMTRAMSIVSKLISQRVKLYSAPEWLHQYVLRGREVIAVAGCHGKTTTTAMVAHMLHEMGEDCGYLVAGSLRSGRGAAHLGSSSYFVLEADEYDTAFFDKRPKFMHYWPSYLILGTIEFDHADIYDNFSQMLKQYQLLIRLLPNHGAIVSDALPRAIKDVIDAYSLRHENIKKTSQRVLQVPGQLNQRNAAMAVELGCQLGFDRESSWRALASFPGVMRRCETVIDGPIAVIDDHAHHPTAVKATLEIFSGRRVHLLYYPKTHTQRMDIHREDTIDVLCKAHRAYILLPDKHALSVEDYQKAGVILGDEAQIYQQLIASVEEGDVILMCTAYRLTGLIEKLSEFIAEKRCAEA